MKLFQKNNGSFVCKNCGKEVSKHPSSSRDHCNYCLYSLHVDINPGDRANNCLGLMRPVGLDIRNGKTQIVYECQKCNKRHKNIVAPDDNQELIISLSSKIY